MEAVNDIILLLRTKLRDVDFSSLKYSDQELLDNIQYNVNKLIAEFTLNIREFHIQEGEEELNLTNASLSFVRALNFNTEIPLRTHMQIIKTNPSYLCIYQVNPYLYKLNYKAKSTIKVFINCEEKFTINSHTSLLNPLSKEALLYGALRDILSNEPTADSINKINFFNAMYHQAINSLRQILNKTREKENYITPFIRV